MRASPNDGTLRANVARALVRQVIVLLLNLAITAVVARSLGPRLAGMYALALLVPLFLTTLLNAGTSSSNAYLIGRSQNRAPDALASTIVLWLLASFTGLALGVGLLPHAAQILPSVPSAILVVAFGIFPIALLNLFLLSMLVGMQNYAAVNTVAITSPAVNLTTYLLMLLGPVTSPSIALVAYGVGQGVGIVLALWNLRAIVVPAFRRKWGWTTFAEHVAYGWRAHFANVMAFVQYRADVVMLNLFVNPAAVGVYVVAVQIAERLWIGTQVVANITLPHLSSLHANAADVSLTPRMSRWVIVATFGGALVVVALGYPFIATVFGADYSGAYVPLLMLLPGIVLGSGAKILANDFAARGRPLLNGYVGALSVGLMLLLGVQLIPLWGIIGAAATVTLSYTLQWMVTSAIYVRLSGVNWQSTIAIGAEDIRWLTTYLRSSRRT